MTVCTIESGDMCSLIHGYMCLFPLTHMEFGNNSCMSTDLDNESALPCPSHPLTIPTYHATHHSNLPCHPIVGSFA